MASVSEINYQLIPWFGFVQNCMKSAESEGASNTYEQLKDKYLEIKAILQSNGVNMTGIDKLGLNS